MLMLINGNSDLYIARHFPILILLRCARYIPRKFSSDQRFKCLSFSNTKLGAIKEVSIMLIYHFSTLGDFAL